MTPALVTGTSAGYTLKVDPSAVDALEVLRLAEQASAFRSAGDPSAALETCSTALAMFGGDVLSGAGDGEWVIPHRARLEEVRLGLLEAQLAARLDLGASGEVIGDLEALVRAHPQREGLWALLMVALYRDGRQADALATYQRARSTLGRRARTRPGTAAATARAADPGPRPGTRRAAVDRSEGSARTRRPGTCRRMSAELVGRDTEVAAIVDLLTSPGSWRSSGPAASARPRSRSPPAASLSGGELSAPAACGWPGSRAAATADEVVDTVVAALNVGGEAALLERLKNSAAPC